MTPWGYFTAGASKNGQWSVVGRRWSLAKNSVVASFVVVLFTCWDCHGEAIFLWRQGASCVGRDRARRVVGAIEVDDYSSVCKKSRLA